MNNIGITTLEPAQFEEMGRAWPGRRGLLSPLEIYDPQVGSKTVKAKEGLAERLAALANPSTAVELVYARDGAPTTCTCYSAATGSSVGIISDENNRVTLCPVSSISEMVNEFSIKLAENGLESDGFSASLEVGAAWVLAVLLDLQRQTALQAAADSGNMVVDIPPIFFHSEAVFPVVNTLADPLNRGQALAILAGEPAWATLFGMSQELLPPELTLADVEESLAGLTASGLVDRQIDGFSLAKSTANFANHFLITDQTIFMKFRSEKDEWVDEEQFTCQQVGGTFLYTLFNPASPEKIWLKGGSYELFTKLAKLAFENPVSLYILAGVEKPGRLACVQCGNLLNSRSKFCKICGTPVAPKNPLPAQAPSVINCPKCGSQAGFDAKFCKNCGSRLKL